MYTLRIYYASGPADDFSVNSPYRVGAIDFPKEEIESQLDNEIESWRKAGAEVIKLSEDKALVVSFSNRAEYFIEIDV